MAESQANDNTTCVVCFKNVVYFSIGECDHPVCFECSTRMRVLCLQNECPICRQDLSRVVFTDTVLPYKELRNRPFSDRLFERQFKIGFCTEEIKHAYESLLENHCKICEKAQFRTFSMLSEHMRKVHERYFCDLCVKHLKIFTSERKCYTRQELAHHRRKGDLDDTSHRGHPLCEFCEERFMDADELYRHLRKEHLYCHLCDADGRNLYYPSHSALAHHFRNEHYLCEDGECAGQHLTAVFRSEIDLKAHKATVHGRGLTRGAARQARTLELQFNITPHSVAPRPRERVIEAPSPPAPVQMVTPIDPGNVQQFPRLSAAPPAPAPLLAHPPRFPRGDRLARNDRNFPALDGSAPAAPPAPRAAPVAAAVLRNPSKPSVSIQLHSQPSASNFRLTQTSGNRISIPSQKKSPLSDDDFPSLGIGRDDYPSIGAATVQPPKVTMINSEELGAIKNNQNKGQRSTESKKVHLNTEAFPALSSSSVPSAPPQWINISKSKEKSKPKSEPPPTPREAAFNPAADFPTLPINVKTKTKKSQQPVQHQILSHSHSHSNNNGPSESNKNKKDKKKPNSNQKDISLDSNIINRINDVKMKKEYINACVNNNNNSVEPDRKIKTTSEAPSANVQKNSGNGDFAMTLKEYPPLNPRADTNGPQRAENTTQRGNNFSQRTVQNGSVPPGFKKRPPCDGMTFTNSAGQTFSAPVHSYIPPPDFELRNRALVKKFAVALGGAAAVENFKIASRAFRDSNITADEFYLHCQTALGDQLESVFPDLVALLPDIAKQQELVIGRSIASQLDVCPTCGQLLSAADRIAHDAAHWPPLSSR